MIIERDVAVDGHTFHLLEAGDQAQETVLWPHGSGPGANAATNWTRALNDLAGDFHHLAPDIIGFGDPTHPDPPPPSASAVKDLRVDTLLALPDELDLERVHLVGNSMGGIIGIAMALKAPERLDRMVLMGSVGAPVPPTDDLLKLITYYEDPAVEALAALLRRSRAAKGRCAAQRLVDVLVQRDQVEEAIAFCRDRSEGRKFASAWARERLAELLAQQGRTAELRARADAGDPYATAWLVNHLVDQGRTDQAITILRVRADAGDHGPPKKSPAS